MNNQSIPFSIHRNNWNDSDMFPEIVYIDTCSVIDMIAQRSNGQITEQYIQQLVQSNGMICWSHHTMEEVIQFLHVNEYLTLARQKSLRKWKDAEDLATPAESSKIAAMVSQQAGGVKQLLEQYGTEIQENMLGVQDLSQKIYSTYGGNLADSKHIAIANMNGINNIITNDKGFIRYPNHNIYTANPTLSAQYVPNSTSNQYVDFNDLLNPQKKSQSI